VDSSDPTAPVVPHADTAWPWKIPLRRRDGSVKAWTLVDEADYERLSQWRWCLASNDYVRRNARLPGRKQRHVSLHREILGLPYRDHRETDHKNGDKLDNRRSNLRLASRGQNAQNLLAQSRSKSGYRNVYRTETGRWRVTIRLNGEIYHLGSYVTPEEAGAIAAQWRAEHMPFAIR
jgi:hypothetical protein